MYHSSINIQSAASVDVPGFGEPRKSACLCFICVCFRSSMHNIGHPPSATHCPFHLHSQNRNRSSLYHPNSQKTKASSSPSFFWLLPITTRFSPTVQQPFLRPAKTVIHKPRQELCFTFQTDSSSLSSALERSRLQLQQLRRLQLWQPSLTRSPSTTGSRY